MQRTLETWVQSLGRSPGGGMATHSSVLAWRIPWTEEPGGPQSTGSQRLRQAERLTLSLAINSFHYTEMFPSIPTLVGAFFKKKIMNGY